MVYLSKFFYLYACVKLNFSFFFSFPWKYHILTRVFVVMS
jgi:hypothetical protein